MFKTRTKFFESTEANDIRQILQQMAGSSLYNTLSSYTTHGTQYPNNLIPFVDKHMNYLNNHPKLDAEMYLANLRLMTRAR
jgi:hypothetical protein